MPNLLQSMPTMPTVLWSFSWQHALWQRFRSGGSPAPESTADASARIGSTSNLGQAVQLSMFDRQTTAFPPERKNGLKPAKTRGIKQKSQTAFGLKRSGIKKYEWFKGINRKPNTAMGPVQTLLGFSALHLGLPGRAQLPNSISASVDEQTSMQVAICWQSVIQ